MEITLVSMLVTLPPGNTLALPRYRTVTPDRMTALPLVAATLSGPVFCGSPDTRPARYLRIHYQRGVAANVAAATLSYARMAGLANMNKPPILPTRAKVFNLAELTISDRLVDLVKILKVDNLIKASK